MSNVEQSQSICTIQIVSFVTGNWSLFEKSRILNFVKYLSTHSLEMTGLRWSEDVQVCQVRQGDWRDTRLVMCRQRAPKPSSPTRCRIQLQFHHMQKSLKLHFKAITLELTVILKFQSHHQSLRFPYTLVILTFEIASATNLDHVQYPWSSNTLLPTRRTL
jgi:hypothetical protein